MTRLTRLYLATAAITGGIGVLAGCASAPSPRPAVSAGGMRLTRAVLFQNGVAYFERRGKTEGDEVTVRIRADQVNDFLKSLTVIDTADGKAVSVSLPLDRKAASEVMALADKLKGSLELPELLDILKGTRVTLVGKKRTAEGRILVLDEIETDTSLDWRVSVMGERAIETLLLSDIVSVLVEDDFIVLGLHKGLDAAATGGVFKVVDVTVHLDRGGTHDLLVSYVVACPAWKPSYRLVLGEKDEALLQGWAVVDNVTGEAWERVALSLTSGAPLAFQYDLYAPRFVERPDLSHVADQKRAQAVVGETSYDDAEAEEAEEEAAKEMKAYKPSAVSRDAAPSPKSASKRRSKRSKASSDDKLVSEIEVLSTLGYGSGPGGAGSASEAARLDAATLQSSVRSMVTASRSSGAVRYDMQEPVSVPDRSSTLVAILNQTVPGEEAFLFTPGGAGRGYEQNPYRVARFKNTTGFVLEPGPISIYSGGTFVGEGIGESISSDKTSTIPFAVDPSILVTSARESRREGARLVTIRKGVMTVESFDRIKTTYTVKGGTEAPYRLYVRHAKAGGRYTLKETPKGMEDLGDAYLLPIDVIDKNKETRFVAVEQTPVTRSLTIWDYDAFRAVELYLKEVSDLPPKARERLEQLLEKRRRMDTIDTKISHLQAKRDEIDERMRQTRENLKALKKNKAAAPLKARLARKLEEHAKAADAVAKEIVELTDDRLELKVAVDEMLGDLSLKE